MARCKGVAAEGNVTKCPDCGALSHNSSLDGEISRLI
jgi:acetyl-CoA carboxylase beta subunit